VAGRAHHTLLAEEKELTRRSDELARKRQELPWVAVEKEYRFESEDVGCDGCSMFVDQVGHLAHLHARDTSFALVSRAPIAKIEAYRKRMGWVIPWYSSFESDFNVDFGVGPETSQEGVYQDGESFGLSVFSREGDDVLRTYFTTHRGVEALGSVWTFLDLTPLGRQEEWEASPPGYQQTKPYDWWRRHDEYGES
jgi:predicted dithiol-disulfide oxidoreductase (DUF899 family)